MDACESDIAAVKTMSKFWWLWFGDQFFFAKAETPLVFTEIWALMRGIIDVVTAFQVKKPGSIGVGS